MIKENLLYYLEVVMNVKADPTSFPGYPQRGSVPTLMVSDNTSKIGEHCYVSQSDPYPNDQD
jgi:hypothetical protein